MNLERITELRAAADSDVAKRYGIGAAVNLEQFHEVLDALTGALAEVENLRGNRAESNADTTEAPQAVPGSPEAAEAISGARDEGASHPVTAPPNSAQTLPPLFANETEPEIADVD